MDRAIVYTTNPARHYPKTRPKKLSRSQKTVNRFLNAPIASAFEKGALREPFFRSQHKQDNLGDSKNLDLLGGAVKSTLIAEDVPLVLKRLQLFVFLSYTAVVEKRLTKLTSMKKKSRKDKEEEKKTLKRSIREQNLNVQKDANAIERIYKAVADLDTAIGEYEETITSLNTAMERLNKAMVKAMSENRADAKTEAPSTYFLKALRTGALNLHCVISGLVKKGWTPAQATISIVRGAPDKFWPYRSIHSSCVEPMVAALKSKGFADLAPRLSNTGGSSSKICIAKELAGLDSSLELRQTHQDLGYNFGYRSDFPCTTCFPEYPPTIGTNSGLQQNCEADSASGTAALRRGAQPLLSRDCIGIGLVLNTSLLKAEVNLHKTEHVEHSAESSHSLPDPRKTDVGHTTKPGDLLCSNLALTRPDPPLSLPLNELLYTVTTHFEFSCRNLNLDDQGVLLTRAGAKRRNDPCDNFDSYCLSATIFAQNGMLDEFGQALNVACTYVDDIFRDEHPRALTCFFEVFIHLIQSGHPAFTLMLLQYIGRFYEVRGGRPFGRICRLLLELGLPSLPQAIAIAWRCITHTFNRTLGAYSSLAVSVRLDYIKRVHGVEDYVEEERLLRTLLVQLNGTLHPSVPRVILNLAHNMNKQGFYEHARNLAGEVLVLIGKHKEYADKTVERIESQKIIAISHHAQGSMAGAELTQRCAIRLVEDAWGRQHAWFAEFMNVLETWLRGWGRKSEANIVRREIAELMIKSR